MLSQNEAETQVITIVFGDGKKRRLSEWLKPNDELSKRPAVNHVGIVFCRPQRRPHLNMHGICAQPILHVCWLLCNFARPIVAAAHHSDSVHEHSVHVNARWAASQLHRGIPSLKQFSLLLHLPWADLVEKNQTIAVPIEITQTQ